MSPFDFVDRVRPRHLVLLVVLLVLASSVVFRPDGPSAEVVRGSEGTPPDQVPAASPGEIAATLDAWERPVAAPISGPFRQTASSLSCTG